MLPNVLDALNSVTALGCDPAAATPAMLMSPPDTAVYDVPFQPPTYIVVVPTTVSVATPLALPWVIMSPLVTLTAAPSSNSTLAEYLS